MTPGASQELLWDAWSHHCRFRIVRTVLKNVYLNKLLPGGKRRLRGRRPGRQEARGPSAQPRAASPVPPGPPAAWLGSPPPGAARASSDEKTKGRERMLDPVKFLFKNQEWNLRPRLWFGRHISALVATPRLDQRSGPFHPKPGWDLHPPLQPRALSTSRHPGCERGAGGPRSFLLKGEPRGRKTCFQDNTVNDDSPAAGPEGEASRPSRLFSG